MFELPSGNVVTTPVLPSVMPMIMIRVPSLNSVNDSNALIGDLISSVGFDALGRGAFLLTFFCVFMVGMR